MPGRSACWTPRPRAAEPDPVRVTLARVRERSGKAQISHGGTAAGEVLRKITSDTEAAGRTVRASEEEPQYEVRSEKSGGTAVHKPGALRLA